MPRQPYSLERIFHPVGQGAFYSETHRVRGTLAPTVVYDCGSMTSQARLREVIATSLPGHRIDLLFLSHFHADHSNGIEFLKPKCIVLPMLSDVEKVLFWIGNNLDADTFDINFEETISRMFPESGILYVRKINDDLRGPDLPADDEGDVRGVMELDPEVEFARRRAGQPARLIESGTRLRLRGTSEWEYVPVNPKLDAALLERFIQRLEKEDIEYRKLLDLDYDYFEAHKEKITKIYRAMGSPNEYSLAVYSGPSRPSHNFSARYLHYKRGEHFYFCHTENYDEGVDWPFCGCLYLGDINLKEEGNTKSKILKKIYSCLPNTVHHCLSTLQVPHHGSCKNFNSALLSWYDKKAGAWKPWYGPMLYVISAENPNRYGHPDARVLEKLVNHHLVNQHRESQLIELFDFF